MREFAHYYRTLGLETNASLEEINQAYRDLAFVWHPDRLPNDNPRLLEKAASKLKEINEARDRLKELVEKGLHRTVKPASSSSPRSRPQQPASPKTPKPPPANTAYHNSYPKDHHHRPYHRDLTGADLQWANLKEKDLSGRKLVAANLSYADLSDSFLHKVNLENANLYRANLFRANLLEANLRGANLQEANLVGADLSGADLSGADLRGAKVGAGNRIMVKLTAAKLTGTILPDGSRHV
jgi:curved DNA-binding protein CbpA